MALVDNLVAYYKFDNNSTASVGGINGTDTSITYTTTNAIINEGASFNGSSSNIALANSSVFDVNNMTISFWIYSTNFSGMSAIVFEKGEANTQYSVFWFSGSIFFRTHNTLGVEHDLSISNATLGVSNSNRYHVVLKYDGSNKKVFINGVEKGSSAYTETMKTGQTLQSFGKFTNLGLWYLNGVLDEFGLWDRGISDSEITELYNSGAGLQYPFAAGFTPTPMIHMMQITGGNM